MSHIIASAITAAWVNYGNDELSAEEVSSAASVAAKVFSENIDRFLVIKKLAADKAAAREAIRPVREFVDEVNVVRSKTPVTTQHGLYVRVMGGPAFFAADEGEADAIFYRELRKLQDKEKAAANSSAEAASKTVASLNTEVDSTQAKESILHLEALTTAAQAAEAALAKLWNLQAAMQYGSYSGVSGGTSGLASGGSQ